MCVHPHTTVKVIGSNPWMDRQLNSCFRSLEVGIGEVKRVPVSRESHCPSCDWSYVHVLLDGDTFGKRVKEWWCYNSVWSMARPLLPYAPWLLLCTPLINVSQYLYLQHQSCPSGSWLTCDQVTINANPQTQLVDTLLFLFENMERVNWSYWFCSVKL